MKLIGSRSDEQMRKELERSNLMLQVGSNDRLRNALESDNVNVAKAYVIHWILEQAEDIYAVLVSTEEVVIVEVPRGDGQVLVERKTLKNYARGCSKIQKRKIAVARDLFVADLNLPD
jgi:hypothetical protein